MESLNAIEPYQALLVSHFFSFQINYTKHMDTRWDRERRSLVIMALVQVKITINIFLVVKFSLQDTAAASAPAALD